MRDEDQAEEWNRRRLVLAFINEMRKLGPGHTGTRVLAGLLAVVIAAVGAVVFGLLTRPASKERGTVGLGPVAHGSPHAGRVPAAGSVAVTTPSF